MIRLTLAAGAVCLSLACVTFAQSPRSKEQANADKNQAESAKALQSMQSELTRIAGELRSIREQAAEAEKQRAARDANDRPHWLGSATASNWAVVLVTAGGIFIALKSLGKLHRQTEAAVDNAAAANATAQSLMHAERAYVSIRHQTSDEKWDGYDIGFYVCRAIEPDGSHPFRLDIRILNTGRTPATVFGGEVRQVKELANNPYTPPRQPADVKGARGYINGYYLHSDQWYRQKLTLHISEEDRIAMTVHNGQLWLVGFVDYSDTFGVRHRAGFCRRAALRPDGKFDGSKNNLSVDPTCDPYNYDWEIDEHGNRKPERQPSAQASVRKSWWQRITGRPK